MLLPPWMVRMKPSRLVKSVENHRRLHYGAFQWNLTEQGFEYWENRYYGGHTAQSKAIVTDMAALAEPIKTNTWDLSYAQIDHGYMVADTPYVIDENTVTCMGETIPIKHIPCGSTTGHTIAAAVTVLSYMATDAPKKRINYSIFGHDMAMTAVLTSKSLYVNGKPRRL